MSKEVVKVEAQGWIRERVVYRKQFCFDAAQTASKNAILKC